MNGSRDGKVTVDVWLGAHPFPNYLDPVLRMAEEFERAHPEYHINVENHDYEAIPAEVVEAVDRGGRLPDIAEYYYTAGQLARDTRGRSGEPYFTSVQRAIAGRTEILGEPVVIDDIVPAARRYYTYRGDLTSMPATASTMLLYTNTRLLEAAGLTEPPRTWDEVEAASKAVAAIPGGPPHAITWPNHGWLFQIALAQQGTLLVDSDNGRSGRARTIDLGCDALLAYVRWWRRLYRDGFYHYSGTPEDWMACLDAFSAQRVAFMPCTSKLTREILELGRQSGFDVEVSPLPYNNHTPHSGTMVAGQSLWLAAGLDRAKQDGALAFLQFLANPRNAATWHRAHGLLPITTTSFDLLASEGWFARHPALRADTDQLASTDTSPAALGAMAGNLAAIQQVMTQAMHDVLVRDADPAGRFAQATVDAQAALDAHNARCVDGPVRRSPNDLTVR
jgi:sn-glycerol 3-phosphate transport system substrate-binding protein